MSLNWFIFFDSRWSFPTVFIIERWRGPYKLHPPCFIKKHETRDAGVAFFASYKGKSPIWNCISKLIKRSSSVLRSCHCASQPENDWISTLRCLNLHPISTNRIVCGNIRRKKYHDCIVSGVSRIANYLVDCCQPRKTKKNEMVKHTHTQFACCYCLCLLNNWKEVSWVVPPLPQHVIGYCSERTHSLPKQENSFFVDCTL